MPRVKRSTNRRDSRRKTLKLAKGYFLTKSKLYRSAQEAVEKAGALKPDVVLFGEELPALPSWTVKRALRDCDLFLAIGTSGSVAPASGYVRGAEYAGARTIYINLEPMTPANPAFQEQYIGRSEALLPQLLGV